MSYTKKQKEVIQERKTLAEIGKELGVTRERVRQIEKEALRKLRKDPLARELFRSFVSKSGRKAA